MTSDTAVRAVIVLSLLLWGCAGSDPDPDSPGDAATTSSAPVTEDTIPSTASPAPSAVRPEGPGVSITVTRVSDGDSIRARSDGTELEIRLIGINAPEGDECFGPEARARLEQLLAEGDVELRPWPADIDDFGRSLGLLTAGDVFVNLALLETGHAVARAQSDHGFESEFEAAERRAAAAGFGLWAADACGEASSAGVEIVELQADAPGDDRQNPNGEWIVVRNTGATEADMEGWAIRDESTRHRYAFPRVIIPPGGEARLRSGCGQDDLDGRPIELFWCDPEPPIWNNSGDTAFLLDPNGNIVDFDRTP